MLTPKEHPFHDHASVALFLAWENDKIVGRVAGIINNRHNEFNNSRDGFFGFFDCVDNNQVAEALLNAVRAWFGEINITNIVGPANFSTNETCGC